MTERDLEARLRAHFEAEADGSGIDRLLAALESGDEDGLDAEARAILADYRRTDGAWLDPEGAGSPMVEPPIAAPPTATPRRARRPALVAVAVALAAALALFALWQRPPPTERGLTPMGGDITLHVTVVRGDVLRPVERATLVTGDRLGLAFSGPAGHLRVFAVSPDGVADLHPLDGGSTTFAGGEDIPLPAGAVLTPGDGCEWLVAVFSAEPGPLADARAAVDAAYRPRAADGGCALGPLAVPGAQIHAVEIRR